MNELSQYGIKINKTNGLLSYVKGHKVDSLSFDLTYVRHGQTYANKDICFQGQSDETNNEGTGYNQLTDLGRSQALVAAEELIKSKQEYDVVLCSPLSRAFDTAQIYAKISGQSVLKLDILKEINFGEWENCQLKMLPDYLVGDATKYLSQNALKSSPSGESFVNLLIRVSKILTFLNNEYSGKRILLFAHGALGNAIRVLRHELSLSSEGYLEWSNSKNMLPNAKPFVIK